MDPLLSSIDLPATIEPEAHISHAANPTPPLAPIHNHPPYAEMITAAVTVLKEKNGSSRQAIAKYIEKEYSNLPPTHSALLTHHLKRLKNNGQLVMVKHSYKLPRSVPILTGNFDILSSSGPKRGPGRPPKPKPQVESNGALGPESVFASIGLVDEPIGPVAKRGPGRPPKLNTWSIGVEYVGPIESVAPIGVESDGPIGVESVGPMVVPVPMVDGLVKRGPGRPPKVNPFPVGVSTGGPPMGKRGRGRPPRPKLLSVLMGQGGPKKGRGRPPRTGLGSVPKPRGRPKNGTSSRPRGRPPKNVVVNGAGAALVPIDGVGGGGVLPMKRPGRPPKMGGPKKPRKLTGRPLGRPKKNASITAIQESNTQQLLAYEDLKTKVEHMQARIKQAVSIVRPYFNNETAVNAVGALQELEAIATLDVTAPLTVQVLEPLVQN